MCDISVIITSGIVTVIIANIRMGLKIFFHINNNNQQLAASAAGNNRSLVGNCGGIKFCEKEY